MEMKGITSLAHPSETDNSKHEDSIYQKYENLSYERASSVQEKFTEIHYWE